MVKWILVAWAVIGLLALAGVIAGLVMVLHSF
jgi:hypothetical protein